ncbi:unnamed protein product [Durusdinium trenchii]|uniref:Peptidase C14 caspase domain-containing protein n=1 Tax=Durusdinium trenchii TaxID=1381693 RepID=A0ABP0RXN6_9DINO
MLNYLCRSCGLLGFGLNNDQKRLVLCIAAESPDSDDDEETSPPPTGFWANVSSFASTFVGGSDKGGLCTQSLLAVLRAGDWRSVDAGDLHRKMGSLLNRQSRRAGVMVRSSVNLQGRNLGSIWRSEDEDRRRALLVGFCYSADLQLRGSWNDVADMQSWLQSEGLFSSSEIRVVTDRGNDEKLTREKILEHLQWLLQGEEGEEDSEQAFQLFFHFSGHGDGRQLLPADHQSGHISEYEISSMIHDLLPSNATLTCVFDCCDSLWMLHSLLRYQSESGTTAS